MRIGIYGGSFNPPHLGHLKLAQCINEKLGLDKIIIIPSNISPQKSDNGNIDPVHRLNMCKSMFTDSVFEISDMEIKRGGKSYTVDTLTQLKQMYPDDDLFLFMGSDMFLSFGSWYQPQRITELCTVCALSRENAQSAEQLRTYARDVLKTDKAIIIDIEPFEVSSSLIRSKISENQDCSSLLSPETVKYIEENKLYGKL